MGKTKKQTVIKLDINCDECQKDIFAEVGKIKGVVSLVVDPEKKTLTVVGMVEPTPLFKALKKLKKNPEILTVGKPKPKCAYCKYFVCSCGIARFPASAPTELAPPPPGWCVPPPCTDTICSPPAPPCNPNWWAPPCTPNYCVPPACTPAPACTPTPCGPSWYPLPPTPLPYYMPQHCDLVGVDYPPPCEGTGNCTIV